MSHLQAKNYLWDSERRKLRPIPAGGNGEGGSEDGGEGNPTGGSAADGEDSGKVFSQEDLNRIAAREKAQGRAAAEKQLAEDLGVPLEEAKAIITAHREREDAQKTEHQKAMEDVVERQRKADEAAATASRTTHQATVERLLVRAGANPDLLDRAARSMVLEVGADEATVTAEIDKLKDEVPSFFGGGRTPPPSSSPGGSPPPGGQKVKTGLERGAERAKASQGRS